MIAQWERAEIGRLGGNVSTINHQLKGIPPFAEKFLPRLGGKEKNGEAMTVLAEPRPF